MSDLYRLVGVGNAELVAGLSKLVQQSNALTAQVLAHLVQVDHRQLHLELGFSSLFAYCVEELRMSEGTAGRRVTAARVCRRFPDAFVRVARAELHLCALCALAPHLNEQNATELFDACKGKTRRQIEELLAVRFPRPDVREQIRRQPTRGLTLAPFATPEGAHGSVAQSEARDSRISLEVPEQSGKARAVSAGPEVRPRPRSREVEPLSADRFGVHFTADTELRDLIERARELASHRVPKGDLAALMKLMVASFVKREEQRRFGIGTGLRRPDSEALSGSSEPATPPGRVAEISKQTTPPGGARVPSRASEAPTRTARPAAHDSKARSRYVAVQVRRETHARDGGRCAYVSVDGRRCNARALLQFDHLEPFAWRGGSDASNLRLLCKAHNLLHARRCFGKLHIAAKIAARNRAVSGHER